MKIYSISAIFSKKYIILSKRKTLKIKVFISYCSIYIALYTLFYINIYIEYMQIYAK